MVSGNRTFARRGFLGAAGMTLPAALAARTAAAMGVSTADLPNLTIKEVKVYQTAEGPAGIHLRQRAAWRASALCRPTYSTPTGTTPGWLGYAKQLLAGKNALDHLQFTAQYSPVRRHYGQPPWAAAIDICLWDLVGKAVRLPVYRIMGAYKDRVPAYASSQHLPVEDNRHPTWKRP